jgi:hypothetical protein
MRQDSSVMSPSFVRAGLSVSGVFLCLAGILLTFAPQETAAALNLPAAPIVMQLLGAGLLGFGMMNWTARGSMLGGIYGRAIVIANAIHFSVAGAALVKHGAAHGGSLLFWVLAGLYAYGAVFFLTLLFGGSPRRPL